jgi:hypothetical protein
MHHENNEYISLKMVLVCLPVLPFMNAESPRHAKNYIKSNELIIHSKSTYVVIIRELTILFLPRTGYTPHQDHCSVRATNAADPVVPTTSDIYCEQV